MEHGWHGFGSEIEREETERTERSGRSGAHGVHALPAEGGPEVGTTGLKRAERGEKCRIRPFKRAAARLGPP